MSSRASRRCLRSIRHRLFLSRRRLRKRRVQHVHILGVGTSVTGDEHRRRTNIFKENRPARRLRDHTVRLRFRNIARDGDQVDAAPDRLWPLHEPTLLFDLDDKGPLLPHSVLGGFQGSCERRLGWTQAFAHPPQRVLQRFSKTLLSSKPRLKWLTAGAWAQAPDLLSCCQHDRHDDHIAHAAAFIGPIAKSQNMQNTMKMVTTLVHTPMFPSMSDASNTFLESVTGDRFMLLMD
ncbi:mlr9085 (plasmid) [Mesorhizobium japonicum MAFF 303099]|uniref:Mlr9085 protein n=1 Tax=Mesorhizobium japonicum (strain LMG 29417 / CECT 9101 / MAFF 303099) TaxID=266835 RepID=Q982G5_RHILO|nr:mlr9085 [Mesorhizobium japonicum MAFF 303099]